MSPSSIAASLSPWDLFLHADPIVKAVMIALILASVASWALIAEKLTSFRRLLGRSADWLKALNGDNGLQALARELNTSPKDPYFRIFNAIAREWQASRASGAPLGGPAGSGLKERLSQVAQLAIGVELEKQQKGIPLLATIGSVAPFVGLFGTVWGIMNAFQGIAATNSTSLAVVAPGIAEALFATALGLVAAIPSVIGYNRASADLGTYVTRLGTISALVDVHVSRHLDSGASTALDALLQPLRGSAGQQRIPTGSAPTAATA